MEELQSLEQRLRKIGKKCQRKEGKGGKRGGKTKFEILNSLCPAFWDS